MFKIYKILRRLFLFTSIFITQIGCDESDEVKEIYKMGKGVVDVDGNVYTSIIIGNQEWMVENLKTTKFNDGIPIPNITDDLEWTLIDSPGFCWFDNSREIGNTYGALYNFYAVSSGRLAPDGWHIPSESEWEVLIDYLDDNNLDVGGKLKEQGLTHWSHPNEGASNSSGFTALPAGRRDAISGKFESLQDFAYFWSTDVSANSLRNNDSQIATSSQFNEAGISVRCVKD